MSNLEYKWSYFGKLDGSVPEMCYRILSLLFLYYVFRTICSPNRPISKKKIGPENDLANFLSVHLTKIPIQITWPNHKKPGGIHNRGGERVRISYIWHERFDVNLTVASRGISNESQGVKFTRNRYFLLWFSVSLARPDSYWDPAPEHGVPWGYTNCTFCWFHNLNPPLCNRQGAHKSLMMSCPFCPWLNMCSVVSLNLQDLLPTRTLPRKHVHFWNPTMDLTSWLGSPNWLRNVMLVCVYVVHILVSGFAK